MEHIINSIMSIDKKASDIMKQTEEYLAAREKDIKEKIESMRSEVMDKAKTESKMLYESIIEEAEAEAQEIRDKNNEECANLSNKFSKVREKLENKLFSRIFG